MNELKVDQNYYFVFIKIPKTSFTIAYFHLYYFGIFTLSTSLVRNFYDCMRYPVHLWLTYGKLVHLGKLVQSGEVNQLT